MSPFYAFSEEDINEIKSRYPNFELEREGVLKGTLDIFADYEGYQIKDIFDVCIITPAEYPSQLPVLKEVSGRTQAIAKKYNITDLKDLHCNPLQGEIACVCVKQEEKIKFPPGSNVITFIEDLAVPYLYGLSYFDANGQWPWGEYSHGALGLFEFHAEDPVEATARSIKEVAVVIRADENWKQYHKQLRKPNDKKLCLCGKRKPFGRCHGQAWQGLLRYRSDVENVGLNINTLFQNAK